MANNLYTKDSIESLSPREFTRLRPGVYCGDTTYSTQLLVEIISNAIDEYNAGHGNLIEVTIDGDVCSVRDYGQGFLVNEFRDDGKTVLEAAFSVMNTSGKYREDGVYEGTSLGSFGIGGKLVVFLSSKTTVKTIRNGKYEEIVFKDGEYYSRKIGEVDSKKEPDGTIVTWQPDKEFFTHTEVEMDKVRALFKTLVCLCPNLTITLNNEKYAAAHGLDDLVDEAVGDKEILKNRCRINFVDGKNKFDFLLTYTSNYSFTLVPYVNTGLTEKGMHISQIKTAITREFNKFFRAKGWLKEKEENLIGDDIQEGMYVVFNIVAPNVAYDAQVKSTITKIDMSPFVQKFAEELQKWLAANEKEVKIIADKALAARKAREAAKKARDAAREGTKKKEKVLKFDSKLADCWSKDRSKCEIIICEGKLVAHIFLSCSSQGSQYCG